MLDLMFQSGWGAFVVLLFFQLPFLIGFLWIVKSRSVVGAKPKATDVSNAKIAWIAVVIVLFVAINLASISYIPAVATAWREANDKNITDVDVTAQSWYYEIAKREFAVDEVVRFSAHSVDTVHGFAIYNPEGNIVFTMMLIPGAGKSSLIHKFKEPGAYKVRCLEYCGVSHHEMNDTITVKKNQVSRLGGNLP